MSEETNTTVLTDEVDDTESEVKESETLLSNTSEEEVKSEEATEEKDASEKLFEKEEDSEKEEESDGAPETYDEFKLPEDIELDEVALEQFTPLAKELNLTQEQAQKLVDLQANMAKRAAESSQAAWEALQNDWVSQVKSDVEMGGPNFQTTIQHAKLFIKEFDSDGKLAAALDATGVGNHPDFIRAFAKVGKLLAEDGVQFGKGEQDGVTDVAKLLFPSHS